MNGVEKNTYEDRPETVAKLPDKAPYPYTSLSLSPYGRLIAIAGKDTVRFVSVKPSGLKEVKTIRISQFFQATRSIGLAFDRNNNDVRFGQKTRDLKDLFVSNAAVGQGAPPTNISINITDIAWSFQQHGTEKVLKKARSRSSDYSDSVNASGDDGANTIENQRIGQDSKRDPLESIISMPEDLRMADDTLIAAAGSNGVVVVWRTCDILGGFGSNLPSVNRAGHGNIFGNGMNRPSNQPMNQFFHQRREPNNTSSAAVGQPEAILVEHSRAVNKIAWHRHKAGVFLTASQDATVKMFERKEVTIDNQPEPQRNNIDPTKWSWFGRPRSSSMKKSYSWRCVGCFKPNNGPIKDIQWSHSDDDLFAMVTYDGFLIVHNMQIVNNYRPMVRIAAHAGEATTLDWHPTRPFTIATGSVDRSVKVWDLESEISSFYEEDEMMNLKQNANSVRSHASYDSGSYVSGESSPTSHQEADQLNYSYHSAGISPMAGVSTLNSLSSFNQTLIRQGVAQRIKIKAAFELSVAAQVEKVRWRPTLNPYEDDFLGISEEAIQHHGSMLAVATSPASGAAAGGHGTVSLWTYYRPFMPLSIVEGHKEGAVTDFLWLDTPDKEDKQSFFSRKFDESDLKGTWQHVLSVGRDGRCLVQSFARGERPLSNVAPSAFAITNLSPFQKGYGSLQIMVTHQKVPSGQNNDYLLSGLRQNRFTALAPGFFKEERPSDDVHAVNKYQWQPMQNGQIGGKGTMSFFATDSGALEDLEHNSEEHDSARIAPEVMHLSRFAECYKLHVDSIDTTKASICRHNASVAMDLSCKGHSKMWNMLASIIEGSEFNYSSLNKKTSISTDVMSFILFPTLKSLLLERADAGDVQTCVVLCEVMEVIGKTSQNTVTILIPGLDLILVRQWYLAYIEILHQMCLFSHATMLIGNCKDIEIAKLNQTSTTVHESCPTCGKPLQGGKRSCRTCRRKVGLCFLCHQPVKELFVMCPGCGHGGCLEHATAWFHDPLNEFHEFCPTGCGHKCNLMCHMKTPNHLTCVKVPTKG